MLARHGHLPEAVLVVLAHDCAQRPARQVVDSDRRVHDDAPARGKDAHIQVVVLVAQQQFVVEAGRCERFGSECAERDVRSLPPADPGGGRPPADPAERRVHGTGDGTLHGRPS
jgi:hypothetical protein